MIWDKQERVIFKGRITELENRHGEMDIGKKRVRSGWKDSLGGQRWQPASLRRWQQRGPRLQAQPTSKGLSLPSDPFPVFVF